MGTSTSILDQQVQEKLDQQHSNQASDQETVSPRKRKSGRHAKLHNPNPLADASFSLGRF